MSIALDRHRFPAVAMLVSPPETVIPASPLRAL